MTLQIRAYFMLRLEDETWTVNVCRDLESVLDVWRGRDGAVHSGVLHFGFDRPASSEFLELTNSHPGAVLLTASARFGLPPDFSATANPVGHVGSLPVYLALCGWGYNIDVDPTLLVAATVAEGGLWGWVKEISEKEPAVGDALRAAQIYDDAGYLLNEARLERQVRQHVGVFRLRCLLSTQVVEPCSIAKSAPPWLQARKISSMSLTVRTSNVMAAYKIATVADLANHTLAELMSFQNFGRKSINDLSSALMESLDDGPEHERQERVITSSANLRSQIEKSLRSLDSRDRDVLTRRMGFGLPAQTLQSISEGHKVTRERIRQIEARAIREIVRREFWDDLLIEKLSAYLKDRTFPLPVLGVEAIDKWFEGVGDFIDALEYALRNLCGDKIRFLRIGNVAYFSRLKQEEWDDVLSRSRKALKAAVAEKWPEDHCKTVVFSMLPANAKELSSVLWEEASAHCYFSNDGSGTNRLVSYGRGAESLVEAILSDSPVPLHYSEIARLAIERGETDVDPRRIHNAAATVGILRAAGTYGLERHIGLSHDQMSHLMQEAEALILAGPEGRQWHCSELCAALNELGISPSGLDKYVLDFALQRSEVLSSLRRLTWRQGKASDASTAARVDIRQMVIRTLQDAGRPLSADEIRYRLVAVRGVNQRQQIHQGDPVVRIGPSLWGLNDRDLPIKKHDQHRFHNDLHQRLEAEAIGVHFSVLPSFVDQEWASVPSEVLYSIALLDPRFKGSLGRHLFLEAWGGARRDALFDVVKQCLLNSVLPATSDALLDCVEKRMGRKVGEDTLSSILRNVGAVYVESENLWSFTPSEVLEEDEYPVLMK